MKRTLEIIGSSLGWFALIAQFILMLQNRQADIPETILRFFSFFTILTNILVALFFTSSIFRPSASSNKGALTALTTFILIVGLIYQVVLRGVWEPKGLQLIVDELLHTLIPLYVLGYWFKYAAKVHLNYRDVAVWLLYPVIYIILVLIRGFSSSYYPYPFLNVNEIGAGKMAVNIMLILILIVFIMSILRLIHNGRVKTSANL